MKKTNLLLSFIGEKCSSRIEEDLCTCVGVWKRLLVQTHYSSSRISISLVAVFSSSIEVVVLSIDICLSCWVKYKQWRPSSSSQEEIEYKNFQQIIIIFTIMLTLSYCFMFLTMIKIFLHSTTDTKSQVIEIFKSIP